MIFHIFCEENEHLWKYLLLSSRQAFDTKLFFRCIDKNKFFVLTDTFKTNLQIDFFENIVN